MPWINLTLRQGALPRKTQHAMMATLPDVLMWWEKVPDTPTARKIMKAWVYEVAEDADYSGGSPVHERPFYFVEIRIPIDRLDVLAKSGLIREFHEGDPGSGRQRKHARKRAARLGDDQRIETRWLGNRRSHGLAARLYERPRRDQRGRQVGLIRVRPRRASRPARLGPRACGASGQIAVNSTQFRPISGFQMQYGATVSAVRVYA
jgi:hypothetical protein